MSLCDVPVISSVCEAVGEGPASLVAAPFDYVAQAMGAAAGWLFEAVWAVFDTTTLVDVTKPGYVAVYNLLFGVAVFVMLIFFCLQLLTGLVRRDPTALARAALGLAKSVLGSFVVITLTALLLEVVDQLCLGIVQAAGETTASMGDKIALMAAGLMGINIAAPGVGAILTIFLAGLAIASRPARPAGPEKTPHHRSRMSSSPTAPRTSSSSCSTRSPNGNEPRKPSTAPSTTTPENSHDPPQRNPASPDARLPDRRRTPGNPRPSPARAVVHRHGHATRRARPRHPSSRRQCWPDHPHRGRIEHATSQRLNLGSVVVRSHVWPIVAYPAGPHRSPSGPCFPVTSRTARAANAARVGTTRPGRNNDA